MANSQQEVLDYIAGRLPAARTAELDAAMSDPASPVRRALQDMQTAQRRRRWLRSSRRPEAETADSAQKPIPSQDNAPGDQAAVAPARIAPKGLLGGRWMARAAGLATAACLLISFTGMSLSYAAQNEQQARERAEGARVRAEEARVRAEGARVRAEEAEKAKNSIGRLNSELRRRCVNSLKMIEPNPENLPEGQIITRATLVHQWFCDRERIEENALSYQYFFNAYPEYKSLSTCQLFAQLQNLLQHSDQPNPDVRKKYLDDAERARALLNRFDEVALKHFSFIGREAALAFEEDMRRLYADVIAFLDEQK